MYETHWNITSEDQEDFPYHTTTQESPPPDTEPFLRRFDRITKRTMLFHLVSTLVLSMTLSFSLILFIRLWEAWILAIGLGSLMVIFFLYFTMRLYMRLQRPSLYKTIQQHYVDLCKQSIDSDTPTAHELLQVAHHCLQFALELEGREYSYYPLPSLLACLQPYQEMWSLWWHAQDALTMRELLLLAAIEAHLHWVRQQPTHIEAHTALANRYITLSRFYIQALERHESSSILSLEFREEYQQKFRQVVEYAIQELHILNRYTPDDPWIHMQLAHSYKDLHMPEEEMKEHLIVLKLRPEDRGTLLRLALLCFEQKQTAQGLRLYEQLRLLGEPRAEGLLVLYGEHATHGFY